MLGEAGQLARLKANVDRMSPGGAHGRTPLASPPRTPRSAPDTTVGATNAWTPELIIAGYARVATNIAPPGLRVPAVCNLTAAYLRAGTAPTGASLIFAVKKGATTLATLTVSASGTSASATALGVALAFGDVITFDITQVGSTIAGGDLAIQLVAS